MNGSTDYKLGQLDQFKQDVLERFSKNDLDHKEIINKLEQIRLARSANKGFIAGVSAVVSVVISFITFVILKLS